MRALHLLGLPGYGGRSPRFVRRHDVPLIVPSFISADDRETILAFFQQVAPTQYTGLPPRIEIEWHQGLLRADRRYLEDALRRLGTSGFVLVIRVQSPSAKLAEIVRDPTIARVEHVALACAHPVAGESFGTLIDLITFVRECLDDVYADVAADLAMRPGAWREMETYVHTLLNPVEVVETWNAVVDVQLTGVVEIEQRPSVLRRMLMHQLETCTAEDFVGLVALATRGRSALDDLLDGDVGLAGRIVDGLSHRMLVRDGALKRWAEFLCDRTLLRQILIAGVLPTRAQLTEGWAEHVHAVIEWTEERPGTASLTRDDYGLWRELWGARSLISSGSLERAEEMLTDIQASLGDDPPVTEASGRLWDVWAALRDAQGRAGDANEARVRAVESRLKWLSLHGGDDDAETVLCDALRSIATPVLAEYRDHVFRAAFHWLRHHGLAATASTLIGEMLNLAPLEEHQDEALASTRRWLAAHGTAEIASTVWFYLLLRRKALGGLAATLLEEALRWFDIHAESANSGLVLARLLGEPDLALSTLGFLEKALHWLRLHSLDRSAGHVYYSLLSRQDLGERTQAVIVGALAWLAETPSNDLGTALVIHSLLVCPAARGEQAAFDAAREWLRAGSDHSFTSPVLVAYVAAANATPEWPMAVATAEEWLHAHPQHPDIQRLRAELERLSATR